MRMKTGQDIADRCALCQERRLRQAYAQKTANGFPVPKSTLPTDSQVEFMQGQQQGLNVLIGRTEAQRQPKVLLGQAFANM